MNNLHRALLFLFDNYLLANINTHLHLTQ